MKVPQLIHADDLADDWPQAGLEMGPCISSSVRYVLARPIALGGFITRMRLAWKVFTGAFDALKWDGGQ